MPKSTSDKRHFIIVFVLFVIGSVLMYWLLDVALPLPVQGSVQAATVDEVIQINLALIAVLFSLVVVFMVYSLFVFRRKPQDTAEGSHFEGNTILEILWTVVPLILVVVFGVYGVRTLYAVTPVGAPDPTVTAVGVQWTWTFEYPEGFVSPELVLPIGKEATIALETRDLAGRPAVLHSFWIPEMRIKQDLVPGMTTHIVFTPSVPGAYKVRCAEMCGLSHWNMESPVRIVEQADYDQWLSEQIAAAPPAAETAPATTENESATDAGTDAHADE
jgi:cytochrome c oxidase subunit 2